MARRCRIRHRRAEGVAKVREPPLSERARNGQEVVAMLQRHASAIAIDGSHRRATR